jgi:hypothetical protein
LPKLHKFSQSAGITMPRALVPNWNIIMAAPSNSPATKGTIVRHRKRGTIYTVVGTATLQTSVPIGDDTALVVYQGEDGRFWARSAVEFFDGRFEKVSPANE